MRDHSPTPTLHCLRRVVGLLLGVTLVVSGLVVQPVTAEAVSWVTTENQREGSNGWLVPAAEWATDDELAGYTTVTSVLPGESVPLKIDNTISKTQRVSTYRLGWYGGTGGRLVAQTEWFPATAQPEPVLTKTNAYGTLINRVDASNWSVSTTLTTAEWLPGVYMFVVEADSGRKAQIPFIVRSPSFTGKTVIVTAPATWQAYNRYGGYSAYYGERPDGSGVDGANRSRVVSFNRPLDRAYGVTHFMMLERSGIEKAEQTGLELAYTTSVDLARDGAAAYAGATTMVTLGHDEYWSNEHAAAMSTLRDKGTNLIFAGGNTFWWRIRYSADGRGYDIYKSATEDPVTAVDQRTVRFSDTSIVPLLGSRYTCWGVTSALVVTDPGFFLFKDTGAVAGSSYQNLLLEEVDTVVNVSLAPPNLSVAAHSPYTCPSNNLRVFADLTYYTAASNAGVVNFSSMGFVIAMDQHRGPQHTVPAATVAFATTVYQNALVMASSGPLGIRYRPSANASAVVGVPPVVPPVPEATVPVTGLTSGSGVFGDLDADGRADVLAVRASDNALFLYPSRADQTLATGRKVGQGWGGMNWISLVPDLDGDGNCELLARRVDGTLWMYRGAGQGRWFAGLQVGRGWGGMTALAVSPDLSGDRKPDLLARHQDGGLFRYPIIAVNKGVGSSVLMGTGWGGMRYLLPAGDFNGDRLNDLVAIGQDGVMRRYILSQGRFASAGVIGWGWQTMTAAFIPGDMNGDRRVDLIGRRSDGHLYFYANLGTKWGPATKVGQNWTGIRLFA